MAEILLIKAIKSMFDIFCFMAAGVVVITTAILDNAMGNIELSDLLEITPFQDKAVVIASTFFLVVRIVWFLYDKLIVERKERKAKRAREERLLRHLDLNYGYKDNTSKKEDY